MSKRRLLFLVLALVVVGGLVAAVAVYQRRQSVPFRAQRLRDEVETYARLGRAEELAGALEELVALQPDDVAAAIQLAETYAALDREADAEQLLRDRLEERPGHTSLKIALATRLYAQGRKPEASALIEPLIEDLAAHPDVEERSEAYTLAGRLLARSGRLEEAVGLLEAAVKLREDYGLRGVTTGDRRAAALLALAEVLADAGRIERAERRFRDALSVAPDGLRINTGLADVLARSGRLDEAVELLRALYEARETERGRIGPLLADHLVRGGRLDEVEALAAELESGLESGAAAAHVRGLAALAEGDLTRARRAFERMARLGPGSSEARLLTARAALLAGDAAGARAAFADALDVAGRPIVEAELGLLELDVREGEHEAARERAERLLRFPRARQQAIRTLLALYARDGDAARPLRRIEEARERSPHDVSLRLYAAIFRVLAGEEGGPADLAELADAPGVDLAEAFGMVAAAEGAADTLESIELLAQIAAADPRLAPARIVLAELYGRLDRLDLAERELTAVLEARPDDARALELAARLAVARGDAERALERIGRLRELRPDHPGLRAEEARIYLAQGRPADAAGLLRRAIARRPEDARLHALLGRALVLAGEPGDAHAAFDQARLLDPTLPAAHHDGALLLLDGRPGEAADAFERALDETGQPGFVLALAATRAAAGRPQASLGALRRWIPPPGVARAAALLRAIGHALAGEKRRAEQVARNEADAPAEVAAAVAEVDLERAGLPLRLFAFSALGWEREVVASVEAAAPDADVVASWCALELLPSGAAPATRALLARRVAEAAPASPRAGLALAEALLQAGDEAGELDVLRDLQDRFPSDPDVALRLGLALERARDADGAVERYRDAIALAGDEPSPIALNNLAYLLAGDEASRSVAIDHARRAVRVAPGLAPVHDTLGWLLVLDGRQNEAEAHLLRAVTLAPARATYRYHLARALVDRGALERALGHLGIAALSGDDFDDRPAAEELLRRLEAEVELIRRPAEGAPTLAPGAELEVETDARGLALVLVGAGDGPARLTLRAPPDRAVVATLIRDGGTATRLAAPAAGAAAVPFLRVEAGQRLAVRTAGAGPAAVGLALEPREPDPGHAVEPDDLLRRDPIPELDLDGPRRGDLHGASDRDCVWLAPPPEGAALQIRAGPRCDLRAELLVVEGGVERAAKVADVPASSALTLDGLAAPAGARLALRLSARSDPGPSRGGLDYSLRLEAAEAEGADREPNDRPEDAIAGAPGAPIEGRLDPTDPVDWVRLRGEPEDVVSLVLSVEPAARAELAVWAREGSGPRLAGAFGGAGRVGAPRFRLPPSGELLLAVRAAAAVRWTLEVGPPTAEAGETEPNDLPRTAEAPSDEARPARLAPGDRDWYAAPALGPGEVLALSLEVEGALPSAELQVVALETGRRETPRLVARFAADGALEIPALRLPPEASVYVLLSGARAPGGYALRLAPARPDPAEAVEPDDDADEASVLRPGQTLRGTLAGRRDRDAVRLPAGAVTLRAEGGPVAARSPATGAEVVVSAGEARPLGPELAGGDAAVVELTAPAGLAPASARWELSAE